MFQIIHITGISNKMDREPLITKIKFPLFNTLFLHKCFTIDMQVIQMYVRR